MCKAGSLNMLMRKSNFVAVLLICLLYSELSASENNLKPVLSIDVIYSPGISTVLAGQTISEEVKRAEQYKKALTENIKDMGCSVNDEIYEYRVIVYFKERRSSSIWPTPVGFDTAHYSRYEITSVRLFFY